MRHNWEYKRLGEVCEIQPGQRIVSKDTLPGEYFVYGGGGATFTTQNYNRENSMIVSRFAMSHCCVRFVKGKFFLNDSGLSVNTHSPLLDQGYLDKYLWSNQSLIYSLGRGAAQKNLNMKAFSDIKLPIPPIKEQELIVAELDKINEIINDCKEVIRNLDALAQSLFYDYFGDPIINHNKRKNSPLNNLCTVTSSNRIFADEYCENGIPFYRGKEVSELSRGENISTELYISKERYELLKASNNIPQINDILITAVGTIGNIWIVNSAKPFYFKDGNIIWLKDIDHASINSVYFKYFLKKLIRDEKEKMANGSAYKALTIQKLKKTNVILPPLAHQQKFASQIEQIELQKKDLEETIANMQSLLKSRMDYWFN